MVTHNGPPYKQKKIHFDNDKVREREIVKTAAATTESQALQVITIKLHFVSSSGDHSSLPMSFSHYFLFPFARLTLSHWYRAHTFYKQKTNISNVNSCMPNMCKSMCAFLFVVAFDALDSTCARVERNVFVLKVRRKKSWNFSDSDDKSFIIWCGNKDVVINGFYLTKKEKSEFCVVATHMAGGMKRHFFIISYCYLIGLWNPRMSNGEWVNFWKFPLKKRGEIAFYKTEAKLRGSVACVGVKVAVCLSFCMKSYFARWTLSVT